MTTSWSSTRLAHRVFVIASALVPIAMASALASTVKVIELMILRRKVVSPEVKSSGRTPGTIRVTQGERVDIVWTSDESATLHLHGYNIETRVEPGGKASMRFLARAAGRFAIETHGIGKEKKRHITLVYVEVHPR